MTGWSCGYTVIDLKAGAFRQFTKGRIGWFGLCIFIRPFMVSADGFSFMYSHWEFCGMNILLLFIVFLIWFWKVFVGAVLDVWKFFSTTKFFYFGFVSYTYITPLVPLRVSYSCLYPINIPLSSHLAVRIKQFENRKIYFHKFWWRGVWHLSTNIKFDYDWTNVKNILHKDLFVRFCTFLHESKIQVAFNSLSTCYGHTHFGTNCSHVSWCPTPYLCNFRYQEQFCTYESHCCVGK